MSTFTIYLTGTVSAVVEVEADSLDEAADLAVESAPQTDFAFADFDGVDDWEVGNSYMKDGEHFFGESE